MLKYQCKKCTCAAFWIERDETGELFFCFPSGKHRGEKHVQKIGFKELEAIMQLSKTLARSQQFKNHIIQSFG